MPSTREVWACPRTGSASMAAPRTILLRTELISKCLLGLQDRAAEWPRCSINHVSWLKPTTRKLPSPTSFRSRILSLPVIGRRPRPEEAHTKKPGPNLHGRDPGERPRKLREGVETLSSRFWAFWRNRSAGLRASRSTPDTPELIN